MWMKHMIAEKVLRPQGWEDVNVGLVVDVDGNNSDFDMPLEKERDGVVIFKWIIYSSCFL